MRSGAVCIPSQESMPAMRTCKKEALWRTNAAKASEEKILAVALLALLQDKSFQEVLVVAGGWQYRVFSGGRD